MPNLKDIQELIKFVAKSGATEVDLEIDNVKISIKSPAKKRRGEKMSRRFDERDLFGRHIILAVRTVTNSISLQIYSKLGESGFVVGW